MKEGVVVRSCLKDKILITSRSKTTVQFCLAVTPQTCWAVDGPLSSGKNYVHYIQAEPRKTPSNSPHQYWIHSSADWLSHKWVTDNPFGPIPIETSTALPSHIIPDFLSRTFKLYFSPSKSLNKRKTCGCIQGGWGAGWGRD